MTLLRRLFQREAAPAPGLDLPPPFPLIYAVGDIHGEAALYHRLAARIAADRAGQGGEGRALLVILGDMIDRGPGSAALLDHFCAPPPPGFDRICLMGNHEQMALAFLADPQPGTAWLDHGGAATLASYGIAPDPRLGWRIPAKRLSALVAAQGPAGHLAFLRGLPAWLRAGHFFCHAGPAPDRPLTGQGLRTLLWSRGFDDPGLAAPAGLGAALVVHGHVPVPGPVRRGWRVNVDTGAYATGRLSAVRLAPGAAPVFLTVAADDARPAPATSDR
jgi:serine/threonine protein phosphatase 1